MFQTIKPTKLSLFSKAYGLHGNRFAVGVLTFFKLGEPNRLLDENSQWAKITEYLQDGILLDMGYAKANGELLVAGKAFAPDGKPVTKMNVKVACGKVAKQIKVIGERTWNGSFFAPASYPKAFTSMPISYSRAYGGQDFKQNPKGRGKISKPQKDPDTGLYALPNLYSKWERTYASRAKHTVACFEPMDITWPQRMRFQGTYDQKWLKEVHPGFPNDTKPPLFNAAPPDQQIKGFFKAGDKYRVEGMHPDMPVIEGQLPEVKARAFVSQITDGEEIFKEVETRIDTVWLFPEMALGVTISRGEVMLNDSDGLDIKKLLLAADGAHDEPRPLEYFEQIMKLRLDPKTAAGHLLNESQLLPEKTPEQLAERKKLIEQAKAEQKQKQLEMAELYTKQLQEEHPDLDLKPKLEEDPEELPPIPQQLIDEGDIDLAPYLAHADKLTEQAKQTMADQLKAADLQKKKYSKMKKVETESITSMQERVKKVVHVVAEDLAEKQTVNLPEYMNGLPVKEADKPKLAEAAKALVASERQSRQLAPSVTVLELPMPEDGPLLLRSWAKELLADTIPLTGRDFAGADFSGLDFRGYDLRDVMLENADLTGCKFDGCKLDGAVMTGATLDMASFVGASMTKANLAQTKGRRVQFVKANLSGAMLVQAKLTQSDFAEAILDMVQGAEIDLTHSSLVGAEIQTSHFIQAKLAHSCWHGAKLLGCTFMQCEMEQSQWQQASIVRCMMIEAKAQKSNFCGVQADRVQFSNVGDFVGADLSSASWQTCGFRGVDLRKIDARASVFKECDFGEANLSDANLTEVLFDHCVMALANFDHSEAEGAFFNGTALRKCRFTEVNLRNAEFNQADLTEVKFKKCKTKGMSQKPVPSIK